MKLRLTFIIGLASVAASCGGSTNNSVPRREAGVGTSIIGGTSVGAVVASSGEGGAPGGATSAPVSSLAGGQVSGGSSLPSAGTTSVGGTATGGKGTTGGAGTGGTNTGGRSTLGGAGGATTGGGSQAGGAGGVTTPVSSASGGATTGGKSTVSAAGAGGGGTMATATGGTGATSSACSAGPPLTGGTQHCDQNGSDSYGSYMWKLWSNASGACLTTTSDGAFSAGWNFADSGDLVAGVGLKLDATKTHQELGTFSADFAESKTGATLLDGSLIGVSGYSNDPIVDFTIADDSFQSPTKPWNSQLLGTLAVDGGNYDIYKSTASSGTKTVTYVYSIRQERRSCGHISISTHFVRWKELGVTMGKMQEVVVGVEAQGGTGSVDFTKVKVEIN